MNREIRFRAWDKVKEKIYKVISIDGIDNNELSIEVNRRGHYIFLEPNQCILMQYTGLKDKNGEEIYEEDIVKVYESAWHNYKTGTLQRVIWRMAGFHFTEDLKMEENGNPFCQWTVGNDLEVIGNIYENYDLIK